MIEDALQFILVLLIGSGGQLVDGTLGMGFGVFSASMLLATGFPPAMAVGAVNVAKILSGLSSGLSHWRVGNVRGDWLLTLIASGVVGGALGGYVVTSLRAEHVRFWMNVALLGMGVLILWRSLSPGFTSGPSAGGEVHATWFSRLRLGVLGLVAGFLNGFSGAYGPFATSAIMLTEKARPARAVGTVSLAEFFVAGAAVSALLSRGGLQGFPWGFALALTLGGGLTAPLAASICKRLPPRLLVFGVGLILIFLNLGVVVSWIR